MSSRLGRMLPMRSLANAGRARAPCLVSQRLLGAGYTGPRESGYDEVEMGKLRAMEDQPFFMINLLNVVDLEKFSQYSVATAGIFKELARGETIYVGRLRGAPVPVKGEGIDTSDYNVMMLVKYPSISGFFKFIDSPEYHAAYAHRFDMLENGKSALIASFPITGTATKGLATKVPGSAE